MTERRALFVTHRGHIGAPIGGVQMCTREYISVLEAAGFSLDIVPIEHDSSPLMRLARQWNTSPYLGAISQEQISNIATRADVLGAEIIFLNQVALSSAAISIASLEKRRTRKVVLSHGCEITDMLHIARLKSDLPLSAKLRPTAALAMARVLIDEAKARQSVDDVITLCPFDADTETWLGSRHVTWLPRVLRSEPLYWRPTSNLFGFVGTLDHAPNLEGLVAVLSILEKGRDDVRVHGAGGPERVGRWLESRFRSFRYLGRLDEAQLQSEVASWRALINPIFCQARGCSMKLSAALAWGIPVVTTTYGRRGYIWAEGGCTEANSPNSFVQEMLDLLQPAAGERARDNVQRAATSGPNLADVARLFNAFLFPDTSRSGAPSYREATREMC